MRRLTAVVDGHAPCYSFSSMRRLTVESLSAVGVGNEACRSFLVDVDAKACRTFLVDVECGRAPFKIPRSRASFAAIASSRAVRSVPSIVFFSRSSALLSGVRNKDLALQPFDQRSLGLRNSLVSILSFFGGSLDEFGLGDFILIFIFPHFPPSRPKLSAYGLRPIANNFDLSGRNVGNNYINIIYFIIWTIISACPEGTWEIIILIKLLSS